MSLSDYRFIRSYSRILSKEKPHELKEFFPESIWKNKSNTEKRAFGRRFKREVCKGLVPNIVGYEVRSNKHSYYYISK